MKLKKICSKILLIIFTIGICFNGRFVQAKDTQPDKPNTLGEALKEAVIPLKTVQAEKGFEDLEPLRTILKDKKIVAMGEATHGTKEFFQMKHRMLEFLVEKMDFRLFGIESYFGDCEIINDYVLYGKGTAEDAVRSIRMWIYKTNEVADMVKWMRKFNENPNNVRKIKFYGFDMQNVDKSIQRILNYLNKIDSNDAQIYQAILDKCLINNFDPSDKNANINIENDVKNLISNFEKSKEKYGFKTSNSEYEKIHQHMYTILQFLELKKKDDIYEYCATRDEYMAKNIKWTLDYEKQFGNDKIMLWAHNGHVSKTNPSFTTLGLHLNKIFNNDMYSIGFDFYKGSFRAKDTKTYQLREFTIENSDPSTFSGKLQSVNIPLFFMDFNSNLKNKIIKELLCKSQDIHCIGAGYSDDDEYKGVFPTVPIDNFDGIIFIRNTSAAVGIQ